MADYIVIGIILAVVVLASVYIIKAKKSGAKCIGCPDSKTCGSKGECSCCNSCNRDCDSNK